jgi:fucose permease
MTQQNNYKPTIAACFLGYIVQAIVNNFAPLLFLKFRSDYGIPLDRIALLVTFNFGVQLLVDLLASKYMDRIGYRAGIVGAHFFAGAGLIALAVLPQMLPDAFTGLLIAAMIYAIGGGLLEVLVSPIVEACPTDNKSGIMSLLHSFYCWGHVGVVILTTLFFRVFGIERWWIMALFWAAFTLANGIFFTRVPIRTLEESTDAQHMNLRQLFGTKMFWLLMVLMVCAGASEQAISQWASAFAEGALGISKTMGDLLGPCAFAVLMGSARALYAKFSTRLPESKSLFFCAGLCVCGYLMASLSASPVVGLLGCAICGFSVGIMWPGTFSIAARDLPGGGTAMFALLALGGDLGCGGGPTLVGWVSGLFSESLKAGLLCAIVFPLTMMVFLLLRRRHKAEV